MDKKSATRVITFMYTNAGSNRGYPDIGAPEGHHDLSHHGNNADKQAKISKINRFHVEQFAYLLEKLAAIQANLPKEIPLYLKGVQTAEDALRAVMLHLLVSLSFLGLLKYDCLCVVCLEIRK